MPESNITLKPAEQARLLAGCLTIALLLPAPASAVGLGQVMGDPVIGEALAIEVALIEPDRFPLECFHIAPSPNGSDDAYFPRRAHLGLKNTGTDKASLTIQAGELKQPVVEFRLTVGCNAQVARDYTLLASPGRALHPPPLVPPPIRRAPPAVASPPPAGQALPAPSLEHLAKQRYPNQPMARAKFIRMMRTSNRAMLAAVGDNDALPVAAEALHYPIDLPKRRYGPYIPPVRGAPAKPAAQAQDRLSIGSGANSATTTPVEAAIMEKAAASFAAQDDLTVKLSQAEATYAKLKHLVLRMEARMDELEAERDRLRRENERQANTAVIELAASILGGGLLGALAMIARQRLRARRRQG